MLSLPRSEFQYDRFSEFCILVLPYVTKYKVIDVVRCNQPSYGRLQLHNFVYKFSSVQLYLSRVIQTGQPGSGADGSGEQGPSVEDESGMGSGSGTNTSGETDSGEDESREDPSGEEESGEDESGEDGPGVDGSGVDGSSSGEGMSSFFLTNLL